jgi:mannose-6-phosphate isomerase-like protein (cupin superfamily)
MDQYLTVLRGPRTDQSSTAQRVTNGFNKETFVFPNEPQTHADEVFDVILDEGGTGGGNALAHLHPLADETFAVREGRLKVVMGGREHFVEAGEVLTIPRGTAQYFANAGPGQMRATLSFLPAQQQLNFFRNFALLTRDKPHWFSKQGAPKLLLIALVLHTYRDHPHLAGLPVLLQKLAFALLARVARWRGYRLAILPDGSLGT